MSNRRIDKQAQTTILLPSTQLGRFYESLVSLQRENIANNRTACYKKGKSESLVIGKDNEYNQGVHTLGMAWVIFWDVCQQVQS